MARSWRVALVAGAVGACVALGPSPAAADAVDPPGACYGAGTWSEAGFTEESGSLKRGAEIEIPQADTVEWIGGIGGAELGETTEPRATEGAVEIQIAGQWITIDNGWTNDDATFLADSGTHDYDLPSVLIGIPIPLRGHHTEADVTCAGDVVLKVAGSATENPIFYVGGVLFVLAGGALVYAGRVKIQRVA